MWCIENYYYYWYSALRPVWAETRIQSGDWYGSGTLHPEQVLRGSCIENIISKMVGEERRKLITQNGKMCT